MSSPVLIGGMADFDRQRRRRVWPRELGANEIEALKSWFFTPGATGECLFHFLSYICAAKPRSRRARKGNDVQGDAIRALLEHISRWLKESELDELELRNVIFHAANFCGRYNLEPMFNGYRSRDPQLASIAVSRRWLSGFHDRLDEKNSSSARRSPQKSGVKTFLRDLGPILLEADAKMRSRAKSSNKSGAQGMLFE